MMFLKLCVAILLSLNVYADESCLSAKLFNPQHSEIGNYTIDPNSSLIYVTLGTRSWVFKYDYRTQDEFGVVTHHGSELILDKLQRINILDFAKYSGDYPNYPSSILKLQSTEYSGGPIASGSCKKQILVTAEIKKQEKSCRTDADCPHQHACSLGHVCVYIPPGPGLRTKFNRYKMDLGN